MSKTILQALTDEIFYPIGVGIIENKLIARGLEAESEYNMETSKSKEYRGCLADCLCSLIQSVSFSEAGKSVGSLTDQDKKRILARANALYNEIGEEEVTFDKPMVYIESL